MHHRDVLPYTECTLTEIDYKKNYSKFFRLFIDEDIEIFKKKFVKTGANLRENQVPYEAAFERSRSCRAYQSSRKDDHNSNKKLMKMVADAHVCQVLDGVALGGKPLYWAEAEVDEAGKLGREQKLQSYLQIKRLFQRNCYKILKLKFSVGI
jgi:hypothetical protein